MIEKPPSPALTIKHNHEILLNGSKMYELIIQQVIKIANILPPSGGMAGIYTKNDSQLGVWNAQANTSMVGVYDLPIRLSNTEQQYLNLDAISGK